jgi:3-hydroxymyristoyl/3-hydroxydecanoyl-(acyl carrier protein) dehydratase
MITVLPEVVSHALSADRAEYKLYIPDDLTWFDGHFPGDPILPAVVQVDWAIHFGQRLGFDANRFSGFSRLKFMSIIQPDMQVSLELIASGANLEFAYESVRGPHSKGTINFLPDHEDD